MRVSQRVLLLLAGILAAATPLLAFSDPTPEELEQNRQRLEKWRADPAQYRRLVEEYRDFMKLPGAARERLRELDFALHQEKPSTQARLFDLMERYADWLERLPAEERRRIKAAPDRQMRVAAVRRLRDREWVARQAPTLRRQLKQGALAPAMHAASAGLFGPLLGPGPLLAASAAALQEASDVMLVQLRQRDRRRREQWQAAFQTWDELTRPRPVFTRAQLETRFPDVPRFIDEYLHQRLSKDEQDRLAAVADKPFLYPPTLVALADKYPPALPGPRGPTHFRDLPKAVQAQLLPVLKKLENLPAKAPTLRRLKNLLEKAEGHWPRYGTAIARAARLSESRLAFEFLPSRVSDLSPDMKAFHKDQLLPALSMLDRRALGDSKSWPAFPLKIEELARKHGLPVPWLTLPGPRERWDVFRAQQGVAPERLPDLARQKLRQFALLELTEKDRSDLRLTRADPLRWERLKAEYFKRKPQELLKLKQAEMSKTKPSKKKKN